MQNIDPNKYPKKVVGLNNEAYHRSQGISKSGILDIRDHSIDKYLAHKDEQLKVTPALLTGQAMHTFCLEGPEAFENKFAVAPDVDKRRKEGKEAYEQFERFKAGRIELKNDDFLVCQRARAALLAHPAAKNILPILEDIETSFYWIDTDTGVLCKCRTDGIAPGIAVVDLKTCLDASTQKIERDAYNYAYHIQAAFYLDGVNAVLGTDYSLFAFLFVEKAPPWGVNVVIYDQAAIRKGRDDYKHTLEHYAEYQADPTIYTGINPEAVTIGLPPWAK